MVDTRRDQRDEPIKWATRESTPQPSTPPTAAPVGEVPSDVQQPGQSPEERRARIPKPSDEAGTYAPNRTGEPQPPQK